MNDCHTNSKTNENEKDLYMMLDNIAKNQMKNQNSQCTCKLIENYMNFDVGMMQAANKKLKKKIKCSAHTEDVK